MGWRRISAEGKLWKAHDVVFPLVGCISPFRDLLITYGLLRYSHNAYEGVVAEFQPSQEYWPIPEKIFDAFPFLHGISIPLAFVGLMTFILILSSVTMVLAVEAGHRMDKKGVVKWMLWTLVGGLGIPRMSGLGMVALYSWNRSWKVGAWISMAPLFSGLTLP
jgi:heme/copper-type cytochrome/quinol oxidase subunit 3